MRPRCIHTNHVARFLTLTLAIAIAPLATGQQAATGQGTQASTPAAFVSRLKAEVVDSQVKVTWKDSSGVKGTYLVYRAAEEFTSKNVGQSFLVGRVDPGVEYFIDTPPDLRSYFYAVLVQDEAGTISQLLVPFRNKTSSPVAVLATASEEKLAVRITGIKAVASPAGDSVEVTFLASNPARDLLLFWSTSPLTAPEDLLRSASATQLDPGTIRFSLPALPGIDYWFAVLDAGMYKLGTVALEKGVNATGSPAQLPLEPARVSSASSFVTRRAIPLPSLALTSSIQTGAPLTASNAPTLPAEKKVSATTGTAIAQLLEGLPRPAVARRSPEVLAADAPPMPGGEIGRLLEIVQGPFASGNMAVARQRLFDYLSLPRSARLEAHARFYLGQTYYAEGRAREALLEFLAAEESLFQFTEPWLDACFEELRTTGS